jgi:hypothetical protein
MLSDVPVFFFDDLGLKAYCMCLFLLRNSKTYVIQLPPRPSPSVGQGATPRKGNFVFAKSCEAVGFIPTTL